jgi:hypothetical protein
MAVTADSNVGGSTLGANVNLENKRILVWVGGLIFSHDPALSRGRRPINGPTLQLSGDDGHEVRRVKQQRKHREH